MADDITKILQTLEMEATGTYKNQYYVIQLADSDEYARVYTKLDDKATNEEFPAFETNTNGTATKVTNYFSFDIDSTKYSLFLIADFDNDNYKLKIGEAKDN